MDARDDWVGPSLGQVLEAPELPYGAAIGRPHVRETVFARDRVGGLGVVATIRPSGRGGRTWYWSFELLERGASGAWDEVFGNGDRWSRDPQAPRSDRAGHDERSGVNITSSDDRRVAITGGVVGAPVATLEIASSAAEPRRVPIHAATGAFTALVVVGDDERFTLLARAADGAELDRWDYDPHVPEPEPPPGWERIEESTRDVLGVSTAVLVRRVQDDGGEPPGP